MLGAVHSPYHVGVGLFAALFTLFAQCANFALFMGASKLIKEHVELYKLPPAYLDRNNALLFRLLPWAFTGSFTLLFFAILAGLVISGEVPVIVHVVVGVLSMAVVAVALPPEVRVFRELHELLVDMEEVLPARPAQTLQAAAAAEDGPAPDLRPRALVYVGSTVLVAVLGYKYISGWPMPTSFLLLAVGFSLLSLGAGGYLAVSRRD